MSKSVVKVVACNGGVYSCGSGVFISKEYILTAAHVLPEEGAPLWIYFNGGIHVAKEHFRDNVLDISIISPTRAICDGEAVSMSPDAQKGHQCYSVGFATDSNNISCKVGYVLADNETSNELFDYTSTSITPERGMSGAPIFDTDHKMIAMITWNNSTMSGCASFKCIESTVKRFLNGDEHLFNTCSIKTVTLGVVDVIANKVVRLYNRVHGAIVVSSSHNRIKPNDIVLAVDNELVDSEHSVERLCYHKTSSVQMTVLNYNRRLRNYDVIRHVTVDLVPSTNDSPFKTYMV